MFDPTLPQEGTPLDAVQMRAQLNGLKALIDAVLTLSAAQVDTVNTLPPGSSANASVTVVGSTMHFTFELPQGQDGMTGPTGPPFASAMVDSVTTLNPGDPATVASSFDGTNVHFTFGIPRGNDGSQGQPGNDGGQGPQGPPFANAVVDSVTTLNPGDAATVQTSFDGSNVHFTFGIPQGNEGTPGEVTAAQLSSAIDGTSNNSNGVGTLGLSVSDPPTQGEMQSLANKLDELINALRR